jgi:PAS domain S-box-containing protein
MSSFRKTEAVAAHQVSAWLLDLVAGSPFAVLAALNGKVSVVNESAATILGQASAELEGLALDALGLSADDEAFEAVTPSGEVAVRRQRVDVDGEPLDLLWFDDRAALQRRAAVLTAMFEDAPIGMYLKGTDGRYVLSNAPMNELFERPLDKVIAHNANDLFGPERGALIERTDAQVLATGEVSVIEEKLLSYRPNRHDEARLVRFRVQPEGMPPQIGGLAIDITDLKRTAARLAESEARLREAERRSAFLLALSDRVRNLSDPYEVLRVTTEALGQHLGVSGVTCGEVDASGGWLDVVQGWHDGAPDATGRHPLSVVGDQVLADMHAGRTLQVDDVATDERLPPFERSYYGTIGVASLVSVPLARSGRFAAFLSAQHNNTRAWSDGEVRLIEEVADRTWSTLERVRAEAALRERDAQLAAFMANAPASMYLKDEAGCYLLANDDVARRLGVARETLIGRTLAEVSRPEVAQATERQEQEVLRAGRAITSQQSFELAGGEMVYAVATRFPVPDAGGKLTRVGGMLIDITEQKRAEAELEQARERLYQSEKLTALGSLLAGVAHELNNPLAIVAGEALMLEEDTADTPLAESAATIREAAERCSKIVSTFLAMARQKPGKRIAVDLNDVVCAALDLAAYGLRGSGATVTRDLTPNLPSVMGDPDQLHQVVLNLLINAQHAVEARPQPRQIVVRTRCSGPGLVLLDVADNGAGVPAEHRRRIWEPYFTTKPQGAGTGIGLPFSRGIAEVHGGTLDLLEATGGATFRLELPADAASWERSEPLNAPEVASAHGTVLVIDDEPALARTLARMVERLGWTSDTAVGGQAAKAKLTARDYDAVLCDVRMPDLDGAALLAWLRHEKPHVAERLGFITGDTLGSSAGAILSASGRPSIEKPFDPAAVGVLMAVLTTGKADQHNLQRQPT